MFRHPTLLQLPLPDVAHLLTTSVKVRYCNTRVHTPHDAFARVHSPAHPSRTVTTPHAHMYYIVTHTRTHARAVSHTRTCIVTHTLNTLTYARTFLHTAAHAFVRAHAFVQHHTLPHTFFRVQRSRTPTHLTRAHARCHVHTRFSMHTCALSYAYTCTFKCTHARTCSHTRTFPQPHSRTTHLHLWLRTFPRLPHAQTHTPVCRLCKH